MAKAPVSSPKDASEKNPPTLARLEVRLVSESLADQFNLTPNEFQIPISEAMQAASAACELWRAEFERVFAPFLAELERERTKYTRIGESLRAISTGWTEAVAKQSQVFSNMIAPALEETRTRERILALGFVPHAALFKYLGNVEKPSILTIDALSQARAEEVWPKVKTSLQLSIADCLGDEKIFRTFDEIIQAHEAGLYQLTASNPFFGD